MPWVRFTKNFNWHIPEYRGRATLAYKEGQMLNVRKQCAQDAKAAGAAVAAKDPTKEADDAGQEG